MAVSQISMTDNEISGHNAPSKELQPEKKEEVSKKFESQKSVGMDDLMSSLTNSNTNKPAGIFKKK